MHSGEETRKNGKHQRPRQGVPFAVTALLVVLALICGSVLGYFGGTRFSGLQNKLTEAEAKIAEYELMVAQIYTDEYAAGVAEEEAWEVENNGSAALTGTNVIETEAPEIYVVVEYNGGEIRSDEASEAYEKALADRAMAGEDVSLVKAEVLDDVLEELINERLMYVKAVELGLTEYSEQDEREIDARAQAIYDETISFYAGENASEETIATAKEILADTEDFTPESVRAEVAAEYWKEKLQAHVISGVKVDADAISTRYSEMVEEQRVAFDADNTAYETALLSGGIVVYNPAGYRTVKQVFFALDEDSALRVAEITAQLESETDETVRSELTAELDELYAPLEEKAALVVAGLGGGTDFDALVKEHSEDAATADALVNGCYYISENTTMWPAEFVAAGMALAAPGDVSQPVRSAQGVHIVRYIANVEAGSVPLSNVSARLTTATKEYGEQSAWDEQLRIWREEAGVVYHPEYILK